jgi:plastocyanin
MNSKHVATLIAVAALACGGSDGSSSSSPTPAPTTPTTTSGFFITIQGLAFTPLNLHVPPGGTVTVVNNDAMPHSVTSQARVNTFVPGAVAGVQFDTGIFSGGTKTFTIPATAANGTVIPYFCRNHMGAMATPNGTVTVDSSAAPASPSGTSGGQPAPTPPPMGY